jgi:hypothetical protein
MTKDSEFLKRYKLLFARYVDLESGEIVDLEFKKRVIELRAHERQGKLVYELIKEYKFPNIMHDFIKQYVEKGTMDFNLIGANLFLVSPTQEEAVTGRDESLRSGLLRYVQYCLRYGKADLSNGLYDAGTFRASKELKLVIGKDATIEQIVDFVRDNKQRIYDFQDLLKEDGGSSGRIRSRNNLKRDMRIKELKEQGSKHREIAEVVNREFPEAIVAYGDIPTILRNLKKTYSK